MTVNIGAAAGAVPNRGTIWLVMYDRSVSVPIDARREFRPHAHLQQRRSQAAPDRHVEGRADDHRPAAERDEPGQGRRAAPCCCSRRRPAACPARSSARRRSTTRTERFSADNNPLICSTSVIPAKAGSHCALAADRSARVRRSHCVVFEVGAPTRRPKRSPPGDPAAATIPSRTNARSRPDYRRVGGTGEAAGGAGSGGGARTNDAMALSRRYAVPAETW